MKIKENTLRIYDTICIGCKHYDGACTCKAFPEGIPDDILDGTLIHVNPHMGDHRIQYVEV